MPIEVRGPDGVINRFPDGTSDAVIEQALRRHYGSSPPQESARQSLHGWATSEAAKTAPKRERGFFERQRQVFSDTFNRSWIAEGYRKGYREGAYANVEKPKNQPIIELNPMVAIGGISGALQGITDVLTGDKTASAVKGRADDNITREKARRATFEAANQGDHFWEAENPVAAGAASLSGMLGASALDPVSWISPGKTLVERTVGQGVLAAGADYLAQDAAVDTGVQEKYDATQTLMSAGAGAAFNGISELGVLGVKGFVKMITRGPEADASVELKAADMVAEVPLSEVHLPVSTSKPSPIEEAAQVFQSGGLKDKPAVVSKALTTTSEAFSGGSKAAPESDPWEAADWGPIRSEQRKTAAISHLETLRRTIKPERTKAFIKWLGKGNDPAAEGFHLNGDYVDWGAIKADPDLLKGLHNALGDAFGATYDAAGDAPRSWADTRRAATLFGVNLSDAAKYHADITGENGVSGKMVALESIALGHLDLLEQKRGQLLKEMEDGLFDSKKVADFAAAVQETVVMDAMARGAESEIGRALNILKMARKRAAAVNDLQSHMGTLNEVLGGGIDSAEKLREVLKEMGESAKKGPAAAKDSIRKMQSMGAWDHVGYLMTGNLLSSFKTHMRNAVGTPIHGLFQVGERYAAAGIGAARTAAGIGSVERVTFSEANAYVQGMAEAFQDALVVGVQAFRRGGAVSDIGSSSVIETALSSSIPFKIDADRRAKWRQQGLRVSTAVDIGLSGIYSLTRTFAYRPSVAMDEFYKTLARRMQVNALAYREAHYKSQLVAPDSSEATFRQTLKEVQDQPTARAIELAKDYFKETGDDPAAVFDPGSKGEVFANLLRSLDHEQMAIDHAQLMAFQQHGKVTQALDQALRMVPLVKYLYVNFLRTPLALLKAGMVDRNPALFWVDPNARQALNAYSLDQETKLARGGAEADLVVARVVMGSAVMGIAWSLAASGNLVGQRNPQERGDGVLPYSFKAPDGTWVQFNSMSPLAEPLGLIADLQQILREHDFDDDSAMALMGSTMSAVMANVSNKTFLQGLGDFMELMSGPGYSTASPEARAEEAGKSLAQTLAPRLLPLSAFQRAIAQDMDPVVREARNLQDLFVSAIPKLSETLPAKRDFMGRPVIRAKGQTGAFQAWGTSTEKTDPLDLELSRLAQALPDFRIGSTPRRFNEVKLTTSEYSRLLEAQGQKTINPATGENMEQTLRSLVVSSEYQEMPDGLRAEAVKGVISNYRSVASRQVKDPNSGTYLGDLVSRTAGERLQKETRQRSLSTGEAYLRGRAYGLRPSDPQLAKLREALGFEAAE